MDPRFGFALRFLSDDQIIQTLGHVRIEPNRRRPNFLRGLKSVEYESFPNDGRVAL